MTGIPIARKALKNACSRDALIARGRRLATELVASSCLLRSRADDEAGEIEIGEAHDRLAAGTARGPRSR